MQEIYNLQADLRRKKEQVEEMEQEMGLAQVTQQTAGLSIFERRLIQQQSAKNSAADDLTSIATVELQMLREKLADFANKNEELDTMLNEESDKLDLEIKKANALLAENK